jgi:hypothetical protein
VSFTLIVEQTNKKTRVEAERRSVIILIVEQKFEKARVDAKRRTRGEFARRSYSLD